MYVNFVIRQVRQKSDQHRVFHLNITTKPTSYEDLGNRAVVKAKIAENESAGRINRCLRANEVLDVRFGDNEVLTSGGAAGPL